MGMIFFEWLNFSYDIILDLCKRDQKCFIGSRDIKCPFPEQDQSKKVFQRNWDGRSLQLHDY